MIQVRNFAHKLGGWLHGNSVLGTLLCYLFARRSSRLLAVLLLVQACHGAKVPVATYTEHTVHQQALKSPDVGRALFTLAIVEPLKDVFRTIHYRYISKRGIALDIYVMSLTLRSGSTVIDHLNTEVYFFQSTLMPMIKQREAYQTLYPLHVRELNTDINGKPLEGREVLWKAQKDGKVFRSLFLIFAADSKTAIKFRYTAPDEDFDAATIRSFANTWLASHTRSSARRSKEASQLIGARTKPVGVSATNRDDEHHSPFDGEVLGWWDPVKPGVILTTSVLQDKDLTTATIIHELAHVKYDSNPEAGSVELARICAAYQIDLTEDDYSRWGRQELIADMVVLDMLAKDHKSTAIRKYASVRRIPHEEVARFLEASGVEVEKDAH